MVVDVTQVERPIADYLPDIAWALNELRSRNDVYVQYERYYSGTHRLQFATAVFNRAFGNLFHKFSDNLCPAVVDAVADRLQVLGFNSSNEGLATEAWDYWQKMRLPRISGEVHKEALRCGDAYVIVWPDSKDQVRIYPQRAAEIAIEYDEEMPEIVTRAAKGWFLRNGQFRLTLYFDDEIVKFVTPKSVQGMIPDKPTGFIKYYAPDEPWPLPNDTTRIPVFHFGNNADIGNFGRSELHDVIPLQDALNKSILDMVVAREFLALPQRWVTGLQLVPDPETGEVKFPFEYGPERIWALANDSAKFGQFEPANLEHFLREQEAYRMEIARVSGTPLHYLMIQAGAWPSGEAMLVAEMRFVAKIRDRQLTYGDCWEDVIAYALRLDTEQSGELLESRWQDPLPRDEKALLEAETLKKALGVPQETIWAELGYDEDEVNNMLQQRLDQANLSSPIPQNPDGTPLFGTQQ